MKPFTPSSLAFPLPLLDLPAIKSWFSPFHLGKQRQAPLRAFELVYILAKRVSGFCFCHPVYSLLFSDC